MQRLANMSNEIERARCSKCSYMDPSIPMDKKHALCMPLGLDYLMKCEIYIRTNRLESRIRYLRGEISPVFYCMRGHGGGGIDTYEPEDEDKVPFYCPVDTCPEYNEKVCPRQCNREIIVQQSLFDK